MTGSLKVFARTPSDTVPEVSVQGTSWTSLFESAERIQPTLAVVDLSLVRGHFRPWLSSLRARSPGMKLIVLSLHDQPSVCRSAMDAGADAFVLKRAIATDLLPAVDAVMAGHTFVPSGIPKAWSPEGG